MIYIIKRKYKNLYIKICDSKNVQDFIKCKRDVRKFKSYVENTNISSVKSLPQKLVKFYNYSIIRRKIAKTVYGKNGYVKKEKKEKTSDNT